MWLGKYACIAVVVLMLEFGGVSPALAQSECHAPRSDESYGPYDYTNTQQRSNHLSVVEEYHFTDDIEFLRLGSKRRLGQHIDYTLRAFPNHHRALRAMTNLVRRADTQRPAGMRFSLDCWFWRATQFQPDDGTVPMIHGMYFYDEGDYEKARERMQAGLKITPDSRNIHYNIGLVYAELGRYGEARRHAREAYNQNFPLDGLRRKLQAAGEWE